MATCSFEDAFLSGNDAQWQKPEQAARRTPRVALGERTGCDKRLRAFWYLVHPHFCPSVCLSCFVCFCLAPVVVHGYTTVSLSLSQSLSCWLSSALFPRFHFLFSFFHCFLWLSFLESSGLCFYLEHSFTVARNFACSIFQKSAARPVVKPYGSI